MGETRKLKVGDAAPDFTLADINQVKVSLSDYKGRKNVLLVFYPMAFSPVCSAQIPSYQKIYDKFEELNTEVIAVSVDSIFTHKAWADGLGGISYPLLSDFWPHGGVADLFGVMRQAEGFSERALIVVDKEGIIRFISIVEPKEIPEIEPALDVLATLS
ncbi:MAG TPA: peroxiredoxin [Acidobacteriota bacterium]|nr:peroxiredoxin [Acidobacteriota bacterium]